MARSFVFYLTGLWQMELLAPDMAQMTLLAGEAIAACESTATLMSCFKAIAEECHEMPDKFGVVIVNLLETS
ncbi:MAG: hypothetical protein NZM11_11530 [Anaerolineales bacterium]|nr:hypothetical protein [Anaerolineales bacterium]MDW8327111.1 hypothetical protein [Anaerolineales bacterium]